MKPNTVGRAGGSGPLPYPYALPSPDCGLLAGTIVLTSDGEMPVDALCAGDRIITRDAGMIRLVAVSRRRMHGRAILFAAGSLGHTRPGEDSLLPAGQAVLVRDWRAGAMAGAAQALIRADALVDGEFVRDLGERSMRLFRLHLDAAHVIYAGGLEVAAGPRDRARRVAA